MDAQEIYNVLTTLIFLAHLGIPLRKPIQATGLTRSGSALDDDAFTQHSGTYTRTNPPFGYWALHISQLSSAIFYSHYQLHFRSQLRLLDIYKRNPTKTMGDNDEAGAGVKAGEVTAFDDNITWDDFHNSPQAEIMLVSKDLVGFRVYAWYMKKKRLV
jgi:hypothetical protein